MTYVPDTIAAQATPAGRGGVAIVRISGPLVIDIAKNIVGVLPSPRVAHYSSFKATDNNIIDHGITLYFPAPHSFTGEDVLELHCHGGPIIVDSLLKTILQQGARMAQPGEFSQRAFLNGKIDLTQAEAIADLINASSEQAAQSALRSLQGEFSQQIEQLVAALIKLRMYVEAAIDFPEEEIDFLADGKVSSDLRNIIKKLQDTFVKAQQGSLLREGLHIVLAGKPNAGKSSLLNCLSGQQTAIVTEVAGTTRDVLREHIHIDGIPLHIIDTAGLREQADYVEKIGIERAWQAIDKADIILLIVDNTQKNDCITADHQRLFSLNKPIIIVHNKIDLDITNNKPKVTQHSEHCHIFLSAKTQQGITLLKQTLKKQAGYSDSVENTFSARRRHLDVLKRAQQMLLAAEQQFIEHQAGELLAEDLHQAQQALSEITGEFTNNDLLGEIFSSFCIGK